MNKDDLLKVLGIIVLGAVAVYISRYIFLPSLVFNLPFIFIFALIFFPIARAKYNREKMDYSITGFTVSSTHSFITVYWNAENKTKSDQAVNPIINAYQNKVMLKRLDASQDVVTLAPDGKYNGMSSFELVTCSHPPCNFAARGGGFSLKATDVASIDELSPCAPRFRFL